MEFGDGHGLGNLLLGGAISRIFGGWRAVIWMLAVVIGAVMYFGSPVSDFLVRDSRDQQMIEQQNAEQCAKDMVRLGTAEEETKTPACIADWSTYQP